MLFARALSAHKVPFELHVYPHGRHGLGLAPEDPHVATWIDLCCEWLHGMGWQLYLAHPPTTETWRCPKPIV